MPLSFRYSSSSSPASGHRCTCVVVEARDRIGLLLLRSLSTVDAQDVSSATSQLFLHLPPFLSRNSSLLYIAQCSPAKFISVFFLVEAHNCTKAMTSLDGKRRQIPPVPPSTSCWRLSAWAPFGGGGGFPPEPPKSGEVRAAAAHQVFAPIIYLTFAPPPPWAPPAVLSTKHARKRLLSSKEEEAAYLSKVFLTVAQGFREHCPKAKCLSYCKDIRKICNKNIFLEVNLSKRSVKSEISPILF